jgi:putative SOS response-associated peptidase YedK
MCGRFVVARTVSGALPELLASIPEWSAVEENFNVAPSTMVPLVHNEPDAATGHSHRVLDAVHWGFVASWKKSFTERPQPFNARIETVSTSGMFRSAFRYHRGIIPAVGYYEWAVGADGSKKPYFITTPARGIAMAAIFEDWIDSSVPAGSTGHARRSTTIITRDAVGPVRELHDRMPVMLAAEDYDTWMGDSLTSADEACALLIGSSEKVALNLEFWAVDAGVGNVRNNSAQLIEPAL